MNDREIIDTVMGEINDGVVPINFKLTIICALNEKDRQWAEEKKRIKAKCEFDKSVKDRFLDRLKEEKAELEDKILEAKAIPFNKKVKKLVSDFKEEKKELERLENERMEHINKLLDEKKELEKELKQYKKLQKRWENDMLKEDVVRILLDKHEAFKKDLLRDIKNMWGTFGLSVSEKMFRGRVLDRIEGGETIKQVQDLRKKEWKKSLEKAKGKEDEAYKLYGKDLIKEENDRV